MVENIQTLVNAEIIAERLLGTPLRRDQLNFMYTVIKQIDEADDKVRENLRNKDNHSLKKTIPKLVVYKQIQFMRAYKDKKKEDEEKALILSDKMMELT